MRLRSTTGFTILETLLIATLITAMVSAALPVIDSALRNSRVEAAKQTVIMQMRLARQAAIDHRRVHTITFTTPRTITTTRQNTGGVPDTQISQVRLPDDVEFDRGGVSTTPDQLTGSGAINFGGNTWVRFNPDGSALDGAGQVCNGVVFVSRPTDISSIRAVTLFGATGRIKGFRYTSSGGWY